MTSRLGSWVPASTEERLDRMESLAAINQLPARYALALDSRDLDTLVGLFAPNVRVGRDDHGREALKRWYAAVMSKSGASVHMTMNHVVDFDDADHAHGVVYCHDELAQPETGEWITGRLQYWDTYERIESEWCFVRRRFYRWYIVDALTRPAAGAGIREAEALTTHRLPDSFDTWAPFWESVASG